MKLPPIKFTEFVEMKGTLAEAVGDNILLITFQYMCLLFFNLCLLPSVNAQSIAADGDFDNNILGWHCGVNPEWVNDDGSQLSGNGSLLWSRENFISGGGQLGGGHCDWIMVSESLVYQFDGSLKLPSSSEFEHVFFDFYWYTADENFISVESFMVPTGKFSRDTWLRFSKQTMAPLGASKLSASMAMGFYESGQTEVSAYILWDDLKVLELTDLIFHDGFD